MNLSPERRAALDAALAADPDWQAFLRHFDLSHDFSFVVLLVDSRENTEICREALAAHLAAKGGASGIEFISPSSTEEFRELPNRLYYPKVESGTQAIWIEKVVTEGDPAFEEWRQTWRFTFARLNSLRNIMQRTIPCAVVFAGAPWIQVAIREAAPDLWSVRSAVTRVSLVRQLAPWKDELPLPKKAKAPDAPDPEYALKVANVLRGVTGKETELAQLLVRAGEGFIARGQFRRAIDVLEDALRLKALGIAQNSYAGTLLGRAYRYNADWRQAEAILRNVLASNELRLNGDDPVIAMNLSDLASTLEEINKEDEAEPLFRRALSILESRYGSEHIEVSSALNNLAVLMVRTGRFEEASQLIRRSLVINERIFGPNHYRTATALNNLAGALEGLGRVDEAERLRRRALEIDRKNFGLFHPNVALDLNNLGNLLWRVNRLREAEALFRDALMIDTQLFGPYHPRMASELNSLGATLEALGKIDEAAKLYQRALEIDERSYGPNHPAVARDLNSLAGLYYPADRQHDAEPLYRRALEILQNYSDRTGLRHPNMDTVEGNLEQYLGFRAQHASNG